MMNEKKMPVQVATGSGIAELALSKQLKSDAKYYKKMFLKFVDMATDDEELKRRASDYALSTFAGELDATSTLIKIDASDDNIGAIVSNATIFAIAATTTYFLKGTRLFGGGVNSFKNDKGEKPYAPRMTWQEYANLMDNTYGLSATIARNALQPLSRKTKKNVLAVMGYLIDQGELFVQSRIENLHKQASH